MMTFLEQLAARERFGIKPGLDSIRAVLSGLGNPEQEVAAIHIAGTNGKGSVAAMCESVLRCAGYPVARYTSPHLISVNERFLVRGAPATDAMLEAAMQAVEPVVRKVEARDGIAITYFEYLTALAFVVFRNEGVRLAVLETGLGGRLDATNVVMPIVSVITRIGLDHCEWLGDTMEAIAAEKAGIIKPGRPVVCGAMPEGARAVVRAAAARQGGAFIDAEEAVSVAATKHALDGQTLKISTQGGEFLTVRLPLGGVFQTENAATAVAALDAVVQWGGVPIPEAAYRGGLETVRWPGRFQVVSPLRGSSKVLKCESSKVPSETAPFGADTPNVRTLELQNARTLELQNVRTSPPVIVDGAHNPDGARALVESLKRCGIRGGVGLVAGFCGDKDAAAFLRILAPLVGRAWAVSVPNPRSLSAEETASRMRGGGIRDVSVPAGGLGDALAQAQAWAAELGVRSEELGVRSEELGVRSEELGVRREELGVGGGGVVVVCGSLFLAGAVLAVRPPLLTTDPKKNKNEKKRNSRL